MAEYACPVWERSTHVSKLDQTLNEACGSITGRLIPTSVENIYLLAGIASPGVTRDTASPQERKTPTEDPRHSLYSHEPVNKRPKSRNKFVNYVTQLDKKTDERLRAWAHHLRSVLQKLKALPFEDLGPGSEIYNKTKNWNGSLQVEHAKMEIQ